MRYSVSRSQTQISWLGRAQWSRKRNKDLGARGSTGPVRFQAPHSSSAPSLPVAFSFREGWGRPPEKTQFSFIHFHFYFLCAVQEDLNSGPQPARQTLPLALSYSPHTHPCFLKPSEISLGDKHLPRQTLIRLLLDVSPLPCELGYC